MWNYLKTGGLDDKFSKPIYLQLCLEFKKCEIFDVFLINVSEIDVRIIIKAISV